MKTQHASIIHVIPTIKHCTKYCESGRDLCLRAWEKTWKKSRLYWELKPWPLWWLIIKPTGEQAVVSLQVLPHPLKFLIPMQRSCSLSCPYLQFKTCSVLCISIPTRDFCWQLWANRKKRRYKQQTDKNSRNFLAGHHLPT